MAVTLKNWSIIPEIKGYVVFEEASCSLPQKKEINSYWKTGKIFEEWIVFHKVVMKRE